MFPPPDFLCSEKYSHLIPLDAHTLIELSERGMGPNVFTGKYFYLGYTEDRGIAISIPRKCGKEKVSHCDLPLEEIEAIKRRINKLSFTVEHDGEGCDGSTGILRLHFPHLHSVELHWGCYPHESWSGIFDLIEHVEGLISMHSANSLRIGHSILGKRCSPSARCEHRSTDPMDIDHFPALRHSSYAHLIPPEAKTLIELSECGYGGFLRGHYFYLGHTDDRLIVVSTPRPHGGGKVAFCHMPFHLIEVVNDAINQLLPFTVECDGAGIDGSRGILHVHFSNLHTLNLRWRHHPHRSWSRIFSLIKRTEGMIPIYAVHPIPPDTKKTEK